MFNSIDEAKGEVIRTVGRLCAAAAVTAPKSGGQLFLRGKPLFIETVLVDDHETLLRLAGWIAATRARAAAGDLVARRRAR
jgi:uncharacterized ferredoxin-like protein